MSDTSGTATEQPADDIRSALAAAYAESEAAKPTEPPAAAPTETDAPADPASDGRKRGADGKFIAKDAEEPDAGAEPAVAEEPAEPVETKTIVEPPANWSAADKAKFAAMPPEAQGFVLDRHKAMEADYTRKTQAIAEFRREYDPVEKLLGPHRQLMASKGFTPSSLIQSWYNVEDRLMKGDGVAVLKGIADAYGIDKRQIARALGFDQVAPSAEDAAQQPPDPAPWRQEIAALAPRIRAETEAAIFGRINQEHVAQAQTRIMSEIESFKSATSDKGDALHPHFDEVEPIMTALAQHATQSGQKPPALADLYDQAVMANPTTRAKVLAAQTAAQQTQEREAARAKAVAARKAGSSVTGAPSAGQSPSQKKGDLSLREQLMEAAADAA